MNFNVNETCGVGCCTKAEKTVLPPPPKTDYATPSIDKFDGYRAPLTPFATGARLVSEDKVNLTRFLLKLDDADLAEILQLVLKERSSISKVLTFPDEFFSLRPCANTSDGLGSDGLATGNLTAIQEENLDAATGEDETDANGQEGMDPDPDEGQVMRMTSVSEMMEPESLALPPLESLEQPDLPTVQFTMPMFFAKEMDGYAAVEFMRIGTTSMLSTIRGNTVVYWETVDGSAKAGVKYIKSSGKVEFKPSDTFVEVKVPLINNNDWDPTLDFYIALKEEGLQNGHLHRYHMRCRVKIIDDDAFPSNAFHDDLINNRAHKVPGFRLMMEYFKMNYKNKMVRSGTKKHLLADFAANLYFITLLILKAWMINELFMPVLRGEKRWDDAGKLALVMIALCYYVPEYFMQLLDFQKYHWKVAGTSRMLLQSNMMRKFMSYTGSIRKDVDHGEVVLVLFRAIPLVVSHMYLGVFPIVKNLIMLLLLFLYQTLVTNIMGLTTAEPMWIALNCGVLFIFPIVMLIGLKLRSHKSVRLMHATKIGEYESTSFAIDVLNNFHLLKDYGNRGRAVGTFEQKLRTYNHAEMHHLASQTNNVFIPKSITALVCGMWILLGASRMEGSNPIGLGTWLANFIIFQKIGDCYEHIYEQVLKIQDAVAELRQIVRLMNYPVEHFEEERFMATCKRRGEDIAVELAKGKPDDHIIVDHLPIRLCQLSHSYESIKVIDNVSMDFCQGKLHVLAGRRGSGKTTLLELVGQHSLPQHQVGDGFLFVPQHLRCLHISKEPLFYLGTLFDNLTYGVQQGDKDGFIERVLNICKRLHITKQTLKLIITDADAEICHWSQVLSRSDRQILNLARGLIANPEVLVIHKPSMGLGPKTVPIVFQSLRGFVALRGVEQDPMRYFFRRPRTCIVSFTADADLAYADEVHYPFGHTANHGVYN
jgi:ABC-type multidrug transport system fused ATPase/permease subunit